VPLLDLSDAELAAAAMAARAAAWRAQQDADAAGPNSTKQIFSESAERYRALVEKFERAAKKEPGLNGLEPLLVLWQ